MTQQNAANSEESASAAQELGAQAEEMRTLVSTFSLSMADRTAGSQARKRAPVQLVSAPPGVTRKDRQTAAVGAEYASAN